MIETPRRPLLAAAACHFREDGMRSFLITWMLLGATAACNAQAAFSSEDHYALAGRWELTSIDVPIALRRGEYVVIDSRTIRIKSNCNEITFGYSLKGDELSAIPLTTTLLACDPRNRFADGNRLVYEALLHSRYQIDGNVLRLFSLSDSAFDYGLEFRRVQ